MAENNLLMKIKVNKFLKNIGIIALVLFLLFCYINCKLIFDIILIVILIVTAIAIITASSPKKYRKIKEINLSLFDYLKALGIPALLLVFVITILLMISAMPILIVSYMLWIEILGCFRAFNNVYIDSTVLLILIAFLIILEYDIFRIRSKIFSKIFSVMNSILYFVYSPVKNFEYEFLCPYCGNKLDNWFCKKCNKKFVIEVKPFKIIYYEIKK